MDGPFKALCNLCMLLCDSVCYCMRNVCYSVLLFAQNVEQRKVYLCSIEEEGDERN